MIADFEGETYGDWKATGTAFGPGPAHGTLPGQMEVSGFQGKGWSIRSTAATHRPARSTRRRSRSRRPYLNFLIGGGKYAGRTCMELLVDGKAVRAATGPNDRPGGSERLDWASWDVAEFLGKTATLRITDSHTGGWGHINVDQIVQSDTKRGLETIKREIVLHAPITSTCR